MSTSASTTSSTSPSTTPPVGLPPVGRRRAIGRTAGLVLAASTLVAVGGCAGSSSGGTDIVAVSQRLTEQGVCSRVGVEPAPGVVAAGSPQAGLVDRSLQCGDGFTSALVLSSTDTDADRDALCAALRDDPDVLCGTGANLWVVRVTDGSRNRVAQVLGSAARGAAAP